METELLRRPGGVFQGMIRIFFDAQLLAAHWGILALALYSFLSIVFTYHFYEKTQSPEIFFVVFFITSCSFEALRLMLPMGWVYAIPSVYTLMASRVVLFARYFGIFSLFAASILATGYTVQRQRNILLLIILTALIIALMVPIDTQTWDSSLAMVHGYIPMFRLIEAGVFLFTVLSFFVATWSRGSRKFIFVGTGTILALLGRAILLHSDTWASVGIGLAVLVVGTWLICTYLHKIYLWL